MRGPSDSRQRKCSKKDVTAEAERFGYLNPNYSEEMNKTGGRREQRLKSVRNPEQTGAFGRQGGCSSAVADLSVQI